MALIGMVFVHLTHSLVLIRPSHRGKHRLGARGNQGQGWETPRAGLPQCTGETGRTRKPRIFPRVSFADILLRGREAGSIVTIILRGESPTSPQRKQRLRPGSLPFRSLPFCHGF